MSSIRTISLDTVTIVALLVAAGILAISIVVGLGMISDRLGEIRDRLPEPAKEKSGG